MEYLYAVRRDESARSGFQVVGVVEREAMHEMAIRHVTTIGILVITDGPDAGKLVVHDRYAKLVGKAEAREKTSADCELKAIQLRANPFQSYNLFGGHLAVPDTLPVRDIGRNLTEEEPRQCILHELAEELALTPAPGQTEGLRTVYRREADGSMMPVTVASFPVRKEEVVYMGMTDYVSANNTEFSFVYAIPISAEVYQHVVATDNYYDQNGCLIDVLLSVEAFSLEEICAMNTLKPQGKELCDAITRLLDMKNNDLWQSLCAFVLPYAKGAGTSSV